MTQVIDTDKTFAVELWGRYALFSRPEFKVERVSYDVITPSAARGIVESIYWHPSIAYAIDRIRVLSPIRTMNLRRNEVKSVISARNMWQAMHDERADEYMATSKEIVQRASLLLRDVRYVIEGHIAVRPEEMSQNDNIEKFGAILARRIRKGQCYYQPSFGCREFPAFFHEAPEAIPACPPELLGTRDLGYMLWDMDFTDAENPHPLYYRAAMTDGVIDVPARDSEAIIS